MECTVKGILVEYEIRGEGRPIVILHTSMIGHIEPVFQKRSGWKRIYINYPGIGKTEVKDWMCSSDDILKVLLDSIDLIVGEENFLIMGFSYSAYLARGVLQKKIEQVEGMAIICPVIIANHFKRQVPDFEVVFKDEHFISSLEDKEIEELSSYVIQDKDVWNRIQKLKKEDTSTLNVEFYSKLKQHGGMEYSFDVDTLTEPFEKPSLIILGRQDSVVGYRDAWSIIDNYPRATVAVLDMAGHWLPFEQECIFNALINEWLNRVEKQGK